ncbi:MAG: toprim domain-containing protein [Clostridia bacterium]|nr:toprim domain-containing protein [Clostridia bacterium]
MKAGVLFMGLDAVRNLPITDYAQKCGYTLVHKGARYVSLKEHDSVMIDVQLNRFWRNSVCGNGSSRGHGSIIDFAMEFCGYDLSQAISELSRTYGVDSERPAPVVVSKPVLVSPKREVGDIKFPRRAKKNVAAFQYLRGRGVSDSVIRYFVGSDMLYQDENDNCVFVSPSRRFACLRGTSEKRFMLDIVGCDYGECFFLKGNPNPSGLRLYVTESVIDLMSLVSHMEATDKAVWNYSYLALSGTNKIDCLFRWVDELSAQAPLTVYLALDNDPAGIAACEAAETRLDERESVCCERMLPPSGKDWNEHIKSHL